jgi:hypothetical protein
MTFLSSVFGSSPSNSGSSSNSNSGSNSGPQWWSIAGAFLSPYKTLSAMFGGGDPDNNSPDDSSQLNPFNGISGDLEDLFGDYLGPVIVGGVAVLLFILLK